MSTKFDELFGKLMDSQTKTENGAVKEGSRMSINKAVSMWGKPLNFFQSKNGYPGIQFENHFVLFSKKGTNGLEYNELTKTPIKEVFFHQQWKIDQETQDGEWSWVATLNSGEFTATNKVAIEWEED